jgi:hypothetical protein
MTVGDFDRILYSRTVIDTIALICIDMFDIRKSMSSPR